MYYQVHHKLNDQALIKHIVVPFALSCASPGALKSLVLLSFLMGHILHLFAHLSPFFEDILKCVHTLPSAISVTFGGAICVFLCVFPSELLTASSSVP